MNRVQPLTYQNVYCTYSAHTYYCCYVALPSRSKWFNLKFTISQHTIQWKNWVRMNENAIENKFNESEKNERLHMYILECSFYNRPYKQTNKKRIECKFDKKINRKIEMRMEKRCTHEWEEFIMMHQHFVYGFDGCVKRLRFDNKMFISYMFVNSYFFHARFHHHHAFLTFLPFACNLFIASFQLCIYNFNVYETFFFRKWNSSNVKYFYSIGPINLSI